MDKSFSFFLDTFLQAWKTSSFIELKELISQEYQGREVTDGNLVDFGYEESLEGWKQGFEFAKENNALWDIKVVSIFSLRKDETMAILSATLIMQGKPLEKANLFFYTFRKYSDDNWKLLRSYIESGITFLDRELF